MSKRDWQKDWKFIGRISESDICFGVDNFAVARFGRYWFQRVRELEDEVKFLTAKVVALQENHTLFEKIIRRIQAICGIYKTCEQPEIEAKPFIKELNKLLEEWDNAPIESTEP